MRQRVRLRASLSVSSRRRRPCWSAGLEKVLEVMRVMVDELLNAAGRCAWGNQYAHLAGLRAASHTTSLAVDARVCQGESTPSKQGGIFGRSGRDDISHALFVSAVAAAPGLGQVIEPS